MWGKYEDDYQQQVVEMQHHTCEPPKLQLLINHSFESETLERFETVIQGTLNFCFWNQIRSTISVKG